MCTHICVFVCVQVHICACACGGQRSRLNAEECNREEERKIKIFLKKEKRLT